MKKLFKPAALLPALLLFLLAGCLERQFAEELAVLSADVEDVVVPGDLPDGPDLVTDTLVITANRSWSAAFTSDVDWVEMETEEHLDLSNVMEDVRLVLKFKDNRTGADRTTGLHITTADGDRDISIRQKPIRSRLILTDATDARVSLGEDAYLATVRCEVDTCVVDFNTNMAWTASVLGGNTAIVSLSKTSGEGAGSFKVYFGENEDATSTKTAEVLLSAEGCDNIKLRFTQQEGIPYVRFVSYENSNINIPSIGGRTVITVKSNVAWKMKVKDGETLGAKFLKAQKDEGGSYITDDVGRRQYDYLDEYVAEKGETTVTVAFLGNTDFAHDGSITLQMTAEGAEPAEKTFTVDKASKVFIGFRKWPDIFSASSTSSTYYQPLKIDIWGSSKCKANSQDWETWSGATIRMHTFGTLFPAVSSPTARMCVNSAGGLNTGTGYHYAYVSFPAFEGKRLSKVTVMNGGTSTSTDWMRFGIIGKAEMDKIDVETYPEKVKFADAMASETLQMAFVTGGEHLFLKAPVRKSVTYNTPAEDMTANPDSFHTWELPATQPNTVYAVVTSYAFSIKWIELEYE